MDFSAFQRPHFIPGRKVKKFKLCATASRRFAQRAITPEPLKKDRICLSHRGGWWAEI
jgi:hypothetical protein